MSNVPTELITVKWKDNRIEYLRQYNKLYRAHSPELEKIRKRAWEVRNKVKERARKLKWNKEHPRDNPKEYQLRKQNNIERLKYGEYKSGAKARKIQFALTYDEFIGYFNKDCFYCGLPVKHIGLDRSVNAIGYIKENIVSCCTKCNVMKSSSDTRDFLEHVGRIYSHHLPADGG